METGSGCERVTECEASKDFPLIGATAAKVVPPSLVERRAEV